MPYPSRALLVVLIVWPLSLFLYVILTMANVWDPAISLSMWMEGMVSGMWWNMLWTGMFFAVFALPWLLLWWAPTVRRFMESPAWAALFGGVLGFLLVLPWERAIFHLWEVVAGFKYDFPPDGWFSWLMIVLLPTAVASGALVAWLHSFFVSRIRAKRRWEEEVGQQQGM